jgi:hypothetical protein
VQKSGARLAAEKENRNSEMGHELKRESSTRAPEKGSHWNWLARGSDLREE